MITPGKIVKNFTTKSGKQALLRYPTATDVQILLDFVNPISAEDTFIRFSGEQQTLEQEQQYLDSVLHKMNTGDLVKLFCFVEGKFAGACDIERDESLRARRRHVGILGIALAKDFRSDGIGKQIMEATISEAKNEISGLRLVELEYFSINNIAKGLYEKMGFTEVGRIPGAIFYKGNYIDEVIMVKNIAL